VLSIRIGLNTDPDIENCKMQKRKNLPEESFYLELFQLPGGHPERRENNGEVYFRTLL
jgi:hypothetical protein